MSSQPPEAKPPGEPEAQTRWPRWRKSMLVGAFILLAAAVVDAMGELPRPVYLVVFFVGYVFLAYGFFLAMNARREQANREKDRGVSPRDRG